MPSRRRIFIAINLPEDVKRRLLDFKEKWDFLQVRWTKKESLHLTLVFIGYADEGEIYEVCRLTKEIAQKHEPFDISFERILYGPPGRAPRMIWLEGKASKDLTELKRKLDETLMSSEILHSFRSERRPVSSHITLARISMEKWRDLPEIPAIEQDFKASVPVSSIDVMESDLKSDGAEYTILESCPLGTQI